jgi:hypothetical protein
MWSVDMYVVRRAEVRDIKPILSELESFSNYYGMEKYSFFSDDRAGMEEKLEYMIESHIVYVADYISEETGVTRSVVGVVAGLLTPHFFNPKLVTLAEQFWWVNEAHRETRAGLMLLKKFIETGKQVANILTFCLLKETPVRDRSLEHFGFKFVERAFIMEV